MTDYPKRIFAWVYDGFKSAWDADPEESPAQAVEYVRKDVSDAKIKALVEALGVAEYVLQEDLHNSLTPRVVDIAYNAFLQGGRPNDEDGGESDWFNDTHPMVVDKIAEIRASIAAAKEPK